MSSNGTQRKIIYGMQVSLDGFMEAPDGDIDWSSPPPDLHQYFNDQEVDTFLYGRRMYETMSGFWQTADADPNYPDYILEYARLWKKTPKVVFSTTLDQVGPNAQLVKDNIPETVARLKAQPGKNMELSGAGIATTFMDLGLVDEYNLYIYPVILGGGKPAFGPLAARSQLTLVDTKMFSGGIVALRYVPSPA